MSNELETAVKELYFWQHDRYATNFHAKLYELFQKADVNNKAKLAGAYPNEAKALELWNEAGNYGNDLFEQYSWGKK